MEAGCQGEATVSGEAGGSLPGCDRSEGGKGDRIIIISGNSMPGKGQLSAKSPR